MGHLLLLSLLRAVWYVSEVIVAMLPHVAQLGPSGRLRLRWNTTKTKFSQACLSCAQSPFPDRLQTSPIIFQRSIAAKEYMIADERTLHKFLAQRDREMRYRDSGAQKAATTAALPAGPSNYGFSPTNMPRYQTSKCAIAVECFLLL